MGAMASQNTGVTIVYWTVCSGGSTKTSKFRVISLCARNSRVTGELPAQKASNMENVPFSDAIMTSRYPQDATAGDLPHHPGTLHLNNIY